MNWLVKEEPDSYSFDRLVQDGGTTWSGVRNPLAQKHLRSMRPGDRVFYYHTGSERAIVGTARVASEPKPDPGDPGGKRVAVELVPVAPLPQPVSLAHLKAEESFADHPLVRIGRLSVMPLSDREWKVVERLAGSGKAAPRRPSRRG
ncbi:MAG TPA: EVE domain-containing protein [Candidatus Polarisedimenticolia bacterium]|jgi:predicted RNA-binding protein with PUA-like domain|nr:EVE domain-containing protein [Candidatus Polarisedimenticolia bacterium]